MNGSVKWFNKAKHFGFIIGEDGKEYFCHESQVNGVISDKELVTFEPILTNKGIQAQNVRKR